MRHRPNRKQIDLAQQLDSIPIRNARLRQTPSTTDTAVPVLEVDLHYNRWMRLVGLLSRRGLQRCKRYQLDEIGWQIFCTVDGKKTFADIVSDFATEHQLGFLESRALLAAHFGNLMQAGLIAIASAKPL